MNIPPAKTERLYTQKKNDTDKRVNCRCSQAVVVRSL